MDKDLDAIDKVNLRLQNLREYAVILKSLRGVTAEELRTNIDKRAKAERFLQLAIEVCLDIAELLIVDQRLRTPKTSKEAIEILGDAGVLELSFARKFAPISGFRNILVHDYLEIDYEVVAENINTRLGDFEKFAKQIATYLK